jgi:Flp pilus assembly protein TadG
MRIFHPIRFRLQGLVRDDSGATLVELAIVLPVFLLLFFGLIDFGRMGAEYVMADKATQLAARLAVVRPAACVGVPNANLRGTVPINTVPPRFGTACSAGATICINPGTITCTGNVANPTVAEIWAATSALMPTTAAPANLRFSYTYDPKLGFLGGPYVPIVTVEIQNLNFQFATPLSGLAALAGAGGAPTPGPTLPLPPMSVSLPAEDLAQGNNG